MCQFCLYRTGGSDYKYKVCPCFDLPPLFESWCVTKYPCEYPWCVCTVYLVCEKTAATVLQLLLEMTRPSSEAGTGSWGSWMLTGSCTLLDRDSCCPKLPLDRDSCCPTLLVDRDSCKLLLLLFSWMFDSWIRPVAGNSEARLERGVEGEYFFMCLQKIGDHQPPHN